MPRRPFQCAGSGLQRAQRRRGAPGPPGAAPGGPFSRVHFNALFGDAGASPEKAAPGAPGARSTVLRGDADEDELGSWGGGGDDSQCMGMHGHAVQAANGAAHGV